jgi:hypothetical protein
LWRDNKIAYPAVESTTFGRDSVENVETETQRERERERERERAKKNVTGTFFLKRLSIFFCEGLDFVCDALEFLGL